MTMRLRKLIGAFVIIAMQNFLASYGQLVTIMQGVIFVVCVLVFRRGLVGEIAFRLNKSL